MPESDQDDQPVDIVHPEQAQLLLRVISRIHHSLDLDTILQSTVEGIQSVCGGSALGVILLDPDSRRLELASANGLAPALQAQLESALRELPPASLPAEEANGIHVLDRVEQRVREITATGIPGTLMAIPLTAQTRPIGLLLLTLDPDGALTPLSIDLLSSLGEQTGIAIENARRHAALRESAERNRTFIENTPDACWEGDLEGGITYVNDAACRILGYPREQLLRMRTTDFMVDPANGAAAYAELLRQGHLIKYIALIRVNGGETRTVSVTSHLVHDREGEPVGYQAIFRDVTDKEQGVGILQQRNQALSALNAIGNILSHPLEITSALDQVCEQVTSIMGMESAAIYRLDESRETLVLLAMRGADAALAAKMYNVDLTHPLARSLDLEGQTITLDDTTTAALEGFAELRAVGYHAVIGAPIKIAKRPAGGLFVGSKVRLDYEASEVALLSNIAERVGMALENAELYEEMRQRVDELNTLAQLSATCAANLDPAAVTQLAVDLTRRLLKADACSIHLIDGDEIRLGAANGPDSRATPPGPTQLEEMARAVIRQRGPLIISNLDENSTLPPALKAHAEARHIHSVVLIGLPVPNRTIGMLMVGHSHPYTWRPREIDLLQTIANETANAIHNSQLYQSVMSEQRKVQAIFDSGISGLFATDSQGKIVMFNRAAERITGWTLHEVQGKKWEEIFADTTLPPMEPLINEALLRKRTAYVPGGRRIRTRFGTVIPVAKAVAPLVDENDRVTGAVGAFWDLSREKEAEIDRASFLSEVAHQLRNPLTAVISGLELLEYPNLSSRRRAAVRALVKGQAERLKDFSQQFLDHQRTLHSAQPVQRVDLSILPVVRRLVAEFELEHSTHNFRVVVEEQEWMVSADHNRVDNILRNLLDNAVNYSPEGSHITVEVQALEGTDQVDVAVRDEGIGIPIREQDHIFKAFYRGRENEQRRRYGHGLGLYIARQWARQMDADIEFESREGEGSTFHLILRRKR